MEEIIALCGRLPLALAIVSARAAAHPGFTLASIAADLRRTRGRLDAFGAAGVAADARTVFSWSYHHLSPQACRLFRLLSLQPAADITAAASASLLGARSGEANRLIAELTNTSLITEHQPGRYSFHDLIRAYAAELSESADTDDRPARGPRPSARPLPVVESCRPGGTETASRADRTRSAAAGRDRRSNSLTTSPPSSWFTAERHVLNASVSLAAGADFGFPAWQLALTMQQLLSVARILP